MVYNQIKGILRVFCFEGRYVDSEELLSGNVNNTYHLWYRTASGALREYVLQQINTYADSHPEARSGYVDSLEERSLEVHIPEKLRRQISSPTAEAMIQVLELDPRPSYQDDPQRVYGLSFAGMNIHFTVSGKLLTVLSID